MRAQRLHAPTEGADAGQHDAVGVADQRRVGGEAGVGAEVLERLLGRAQVADLVVEDGDQGHVRHTTPLVDGMPPPSTRTASRRQRATPLKVASTMWWVLRPSRSFTCSVMPGGGGEALPEVLGHLGVERRVAERQHLAEGHVVHGVGAAGQVEGHLHERLVERVQAAGEAADAGLVAQRLAEHLADGDADVLDGVVAVDVEVARGLHVEVEAAVAAELVEHVVEEREPGGRA